MFEDRAQGKTSAREHHRLLQHIRNRDAVKAEALIKATGRTYSQEYVVFLRARGGKIAHLREYFDPVRAAKALDAPILGLAN